MEEVEQVIVTVLDVLVDGEWGLRAHSLLLSPKWLLRKARILETKKEVCVVHV